MGPSVVVVGSGPGGFYTVDALLAAELGCRIDIIERLPTPFGLIRGGVAPDHQTTKRVSKRFERSALHPHVRYYGNVELGRDVSVDELREIYDAVVLATGAALDRPLGIPGEDKKGVHGAAAFVGWYNAHPDFRELAPDLATRGVAVIGVGNVAIDIARVLVKTPAEMASSDLPAYAADAIEAAPITDVWMFGRRGPIEAKFTNVELREMGQLENCHAVVDPAQLPDTVEGEMSPRDRRLREKNLATLKAFTALADAGKEKRVHFAFYAKPVEILGGERVEGLRLERTEVVEGRAVGSGAFFEVSCGLVLPAIGYYSEPVCGVPFDQRAGIAAHRDGRVGAGVYAVGWVKRGPTGVIGTNKPDGETAAHDILADFPEGRKPGRPALEHLLRERAVRWIDYDDWKKIERLEIESAPTDAPRCKFATIAEMLAALDSV